MHSTNCLLPSFRRKITRRRLAVATACVLASGGVLAGTFGAPLVKRPPGQKNALVVQSVEPPPRPVLVHVPHAVTSAQDALAAITASDASGAQIVTLPYSAHQTYSVPLRVGMFTTFSIPTDEPIQQFAVSNPAAVQLLVSSDTNTAMLKLIQPITVVGTIVTKKHIFYVNIKPANDESPWYQGVNWSFDTQKFGASMFNSGVYTAPPGAGAGPDGMASSQAGDPSDDLFTGQPNFNYSVKGKAPFKPRAVWDNGRFTWIQFAKNVQALPALFAKGPNGLEIVNYTVHGDGTQLLVNRLMPEFVLKLGKSEIHVKANR